MNNNSKATPSGVKATRQGKDTKKRANDYEIKGRRISK
jgi:hypothetical protein